MRKQRRGRRLSAVALGLAVFGLVPAIARATTFTVDRSDDVAAATACTAAANDCSLRGAISSANADPGADTIDFSVSGTIPLTGGALAIQQDLTINGPGPASLAVSGKKASQVFSVGNGTATGPTVTISGLTITQGAGYNGAGIASGYSKLSLDNIVLSNNHADNNGGGIFNIGDAVSFNNCTISGNSAGTGGGGIFNYTGTLSVSNSTLSGNTAGGGGAIANAAEGSVGSTLSVSNSTLSGNTAANGGGAITNNGTLTVSKSILSSNHAGNDGGAINNSGAIGGTVSVNRSTLSGNTAGTNGGAIANTGVFTITNSTLSGNSSSSCGAIFTFNATLTIVRSTLSGNHATKNGGAIGNFFTGDSSSTLKVSKSTLSGNTAGTDGGAIANRSTLTVSNSTLSANTAANGGGIFDEGSAALRSSIVAGNHAGSGSDGKGSFSSRGFNLIGKSNGMTGFTNGVKHDQVGTSAAPLNPRLGPLQDNGGPTRTMALLLGSPAIDKGSSSSLTSDQRGRPRPVDLPGIVNADDGSDSGAFERQLVEPGSIQGHTFHDLNGDGVQDPGESSLINWRIFLDTNNDGTLDTGEPSQLTDANGNYRFTNLPSGTYHVREVRRSHWVQTAPEYTALLTGADETPPNSSLATGFARFSLEGGTRSLSFEVSFANTSGTTSGLHIHLGAPGVPGPILYDLTPAAGPATGFTSPVTGTVVISASDLADLRAGNLYVNLHTTPDFGGGEIRGQILRRKVNDVILTNGMNIKHRDFGNFKLMSISGQKFNDLDGNSIQGTDEPGLANWRIFLDRNRNGKYDTNEPSQLTDSAGHYQFTKLGPGRYRVREVEQNGWQRTTPNPTAIRASSGQDVTGVDFGNHQVSAPGT